MCVQVPTSTYVDQRRTFSVFLCHSAYFFEAWSLPELRAYVIFLTILEVSKSQQLSDSTLFSVRIIVTQGTWMVNVGCGSKSLPHAYKESALQHQDITSSTQILKIKK